MDLYRVFPWVARARKGHPGHPLYISPIQGTGRIDNPEHYQSLYISDSPAGAVAAAFGNRAIWTDALLQGRPSIPQSQTALAKCVAEPLKVLDLDDPRVLLNRKLKPSRVVTRKRSVTQAWALAIFQERQWDGIRWWSYHDPRWGSHGLWNFQKLRVARIDVLTRDHPAVLEAASVLNRLWQAS